VGKCQTVNGLKEGMPVKHDYDFRHTDDNTPAAVVEVAIQNASSGSDYASLEACFRELPGITGTHLDRTRGVAHLTV
jgi:Cu2+-exporting ATPase